MACSWGPRPAGRYLERSAKYDYGIPLLGCAHRPPSFRDTSRQDSKAHFAFAVTLRCGLREFWRWVVLLNVALSTNVVLAGAQVLEATRDTAALSLDVAISIRSHNGGAPVHFSPDGVWIAHTVITSTTVSRGQNGLFSATGTPLSWGDRRMEATLTRASGDSTLRLGGHDASSWSPSWSPAGDRVAFYSNEGGEAGLWIWERSTRIARRVADVIVRPAWGAEIPQWSSRGDRVLVKVILAGLSLAEANARGVLGGAVPNIQSGPRAPAVVVRRSPPEPASAAARMPRPRQWRSLPLLSAIASSRSERTLQSSMSRPVGPSASYPMPSCSRTPSPRMTARLSIRC